MTHDELRALLPWYAKRTLAQNERELVARHLESCPGCARELEDIGMLLAVSERPNRDVPDSSNDLLERTLQKISRHEGNRAASKRWQIPLSLAASLMVAVTLAIMLHPKKEAIDPMPSFSTGGNAYQAELIVELLTDGDLDVREVLELMYFAS